MPAMEKDGNRPNSAAAIIIAVASVIILHSVPYNLVLDDAYITIHYSENLINGNGLVFNPGERAYGTSAPLYALILGMLGWMGLPLLAAARMVSMLSGIGLIFAGTRLGDKIFDSPQGGLLGAFFLATLTPVFLLGLSGMESLLFLFILAAGFSLCEDRPLCSVLVFGLGLGVRIESIVALGIVALSAALRTTGKRRFLPLALAGFMVALYCLGGFLYYGLLLPGSISQKAGRPSTIMGGLVLVKYFAAMLFGFYPGATFRITPGLALPPLAALFFITSKVRASRYLPLVSFGLLYMAAYIFSGKEYARFFPWYFVPPLISISLPAGVFAAEAFSRMSGRVNSDLIRTSWLSMCMVLWLALGVYPSYRGMKGAVFQCNHRERAYAAIGIWCSNNSPPGSLVAAIEVGAIGYYSERKILDLFGLISPEVVALGAKESLKTLKPDYLVAKTIFPHAEWGKEILGGSYQWMLWRDIWIGGRKEKPFPDSKQLEQIYRQ